MELDATIKLWDVVYAVVVCLGHETQRGKSQEVHKLDGNKWQSYAVSLRMNKESLATVEPPATPMNEPRTNLANSHT